MNRRIKHGGRRNTLSLSQSISSILLKHLQQFLRPRSRKISSWFPGVFLLCKSRPSYLPLMCSSLGYLEIHNSLDLGTIVFVQRAAGFLRTCGEKKVSSNTTWSRLGERTGTGDTRGKNSGSTPRESSACETQIMIPREILKSV